MSIFHEKRPFAARMDIPKRKRFMKFIAKIFCLDLLVGFSILFAQSFGFRVDKGVVEYDPIVEASGIAASRQNPKVLWTHNDSGGGNKIFALNSDGRHLGVYIIAGVLSRDWEDIAVGPGPEEGVEYIYIGEVGDNARDDEIKYIYRVREPKVDAQQTPVDTVLYDVERFPFRYPDEIQNCETIMIDPPTRDLYIVTKRGDGARVYRAAYPQKFYAVPTTEVTTVELVATLDLSVAVGGDISFDGREILIKFRNKIMYWRRDSTQTVAEALIEEPVQVPYIWEPQGEAVCWDATASGYYTISEERGGTPAHLYYYPRIEETSVDDSPRTPFSFSLGQNYPNPFNSATRIIYSLSAEGRVTLTIFDSMGREIDSFSAFQSLGSHAYLFRADGLASGVYYYRLRFNERAIGTRRMLFLK